MHWGGPWLKRGFNELKLQLGGGPGLLQMNANVFSRSKVSFVVLCF